MTPNEANNDDTVRRIAQLAKESPSDIMLTKKELAQRLKLTVRTIENWQHRGVLPYIKVGKVVLFHWPTVLDVLNSHFTVNRPRPGPPRKTL
jgi:excisionase family DNA binding protein